MFTQIDMNTFKHCRSTSNNSLAICPHLPDIINLSDKLKELQLDFERYRQITSEEKRFLEKRLTDIIREKDHQIQIASHHSLLHTHSNPNFTLQNSHHSVYTDSLINEKNAEIASLRDKLNRSMDENRRMNSTNQTHKFEAQNEKCSIEIALKEKELVIQRIKNEFEKTTDQFSKDNFSRKLLIEELTNENKELRVKLDIYQTRILNMEHSHKQAMQTTEYHNEQQLTQTISNFNTQLKTKIHSAAENLLDLVEHKNDQKIKKTIFNIWLEKLRMNKMQHEFVSKHKKDGVKKLTTSIENICEKISVCTVNNLYKIIERSVIEANQKRKNPFGIFVNHFEEAMKTNNVYKKTLIFSYFSLNELLKKFDHEKELPTNVAQLEMSGFNKKNLMIAEHVMEIEQKIKKIGSGKLKDQKERVLMVYQLFMLIHRAEFPIVDSVVEIEVVLRQVMNSMILEQVKSIIGEGKI